jgi:RNA polymerase sigma factor (sigma-70 family)
MVEESSAGKSEAWFGAILQEYGGFLRNSIAKICPKDLGIQVDDIEQEAQVRLWRALQSEKKVTDLASYIYRIVVSTTIDAIRRVKTRREEPLQLAESSDQNNVATISLIDDVERSPERLAERQQIVEKVKTCLARLPENRRRAVGLFLEEFSSQEIATLLGWSEPKARNLVYRGLNDLRVALKAEGIECE